MPGHDRPQTNQFIVNPSNQGLVTATNGSGDFPDALTDDDTGEGGAQATVTTLDSLTLGGTIFNDANADGVFATPEVGVDGVTVAASMSTTTGTNVFDAGDTGRSSGGATTTNGGGDYSFTGLAPGDYIVVIDQSNFDSPAEH